ncbi:sterol 3beta-glucosyltransferase [Amorphus suaedae]
MNILILTYGSRGDVQPFVALGRGLRDAGHRVTLATSSRFRSFVEDHGLAFQPMSDALLALVDTDEGKDLMENGGRLLGLATRAIRLAKRMRPANEQLLRDSYRAAAATGPDLIVFHPKMAGAPHIAEKLGIGCVLATPVPILLPTRDWRFPIFPNLPLGGRYNHATHRAIRTLINRSLRGYVRDFRQELGLPPLRDYSLTRMADGRPIPILHAHSEAVVPKPPDWPDEAHVTGYWFLDEDGPPPPELPRFLEQGPPPVYVGFGSMSGRDPARLAALVVEALRERGLRGILATGWGGLKGHDLPASILQVDHAPHGWLLPRVAAVVHHGGAGTTAAALRAGRPSVVVPFFADQPFWADRVHALGAGPKPIPARRLRARTLATALGQATADSAMMARAAEIGRRIRAEDGVANAVALIERYACGRPPLASQDGPCSTPD